MANPTNNNTLKYRVGQLEDNYKSLAKDMKLILTNHLPHMKKEMVKITGEIKSIRSEVRAYAVINAASIIVGLIVAKFIL